MKCPNCGSENIVKKSFEHFWIARRLDTVEGYVCNDCKRGWVEVEADK